MRAPNDRTISRTLQTSLLLAIATGVGTWAALYLLPTWLPRMSASLLNSDPKAYWYLARASACVAFGLLWVTMLLGLSITSRVAQLWPGGPIAFDVHQYISLLALGFAIFHVMILLGDHYMKYSLGSLLLPFASGTYRPTWVGIGQVNLYLMLIVGLSFYVRKLIGQRLWRLIHYLSLVIFVLALIHGIQSGTDSATIWVRGMYWASGCSVLFLALYRALFRKQTTRSVSVQR